MRKVMRGDRWIAVELAIGVAFWAAIWLVFR